jgi:hypothetical protein
LRPHLATSLPFRGPRHHNACNVFAATSVEIPGRRPRGLRRIVAVLVEGLRVAEPFPRYVPGGRCDKPSSRLSYRARTTNGSNFSYRVPGSRYGFARVANAGGFTDNPLEASSLRMFTRRARRSGVDQAVVRVADPPPEQEGLRGEVPARRPSASHGRSMSCDSLWSLARFQRCPQRHLVDTAYRSPLEGSTRTLPSLPDLPPSFSEMDRGRGSRWRTRSSGRRSRREGRDRPLGVLHRRRIRYSKKGGRVSERPSGAKVRNS